MLRNINIMTMIQGLAEQVTEDSCIRLETEGWTVYFRTLTKWEAYIAAGVFSTYEEAKAYAIADDIW